MNPQNQNLSPYQNQSQFPNYNNQPQQMPYNQPNYSNINPYGQPKPNYGNHSNVNLPKQPFQQNLPHVKRKTIDDSPDSDEKWKGFGPEPYISKQYDPK